MSDMNVLHGVGVPVFALKCEQPRVFLAWNPRLEAISGIPAYSALGKTPECVLGPVGRDLTNAATEGCMRITGLGSVMLKRTNDVYVGTVSDHEREALRACNRFDIELYRHAQAVFESRLAED